MRIAHTVEFYRPKVGGAEKVVAEVSERLAARGHDVTVLTSHIPGTSREEDVNGVRVRRFRVSGNGATRIKGDVDAYRDELRSGGYDVMLNYACQAWPTDLVYDILDDLPFMKFAAPCGYSALKGSAAKRAVFARYFRRLPRALAAYDRVVYHSRAYVDYEMGRRWGLTNGVIIPNGVDTNELRPRASSRAKPPAIVTIGNHYRAKNHDDFFALSERLSGDDAGFGLIATPERVRRGCLDSCRRRAADGSVALIDGSDRRDVVTALSTASIFVLTSRIECSPLTILEALAVGVPFVTYDVGCVRDFPGGIVVRDLDEMEEAVRRLLADQDMRDRLSNEGRAFAEQRSWERIVDLYEDLYRRTGAERQRPTRIDLKADADVT